jgi:HTH-type transcriptional regulator / antitoxin HipB
VNHRKALPYGKILSMEDLALIVRQKRKQDKLTQADFAAICGVGTRFISDLENGKSTVEFGKVLQVIKALGLALTVFPRGEKGINIINALGMGSRGIYSQDKKGKEDK